MPLSDVASYPLWLNVSIFAAAAIIVWIAGARLTRNVDAIAARIKMAQAFAGMLLLGGITSLPEAANVITSSATGNPELGINNVLGSAAINVLLLALADACIGRRAVTGIVAHPSTMMMATLCMLVLTVMAGAVTLGDIQVIGVGVGGATVCAISVGFFCLATGYDKRSPWRLAGGEESAVATRRDEDIPTSLQALWARTGIYGALIFASGYALSQTGSAIADQSGLGSPLVGFALIGVVTSMPELSTIVTALRIRRPEMAFGQVLGTNFINLSMILLADLVYVGGPVINELGHFEVISALLGAGLIGIFMVGLLEHRDRTILQMGYDSAAVIVVFGFGLIILSSLAR
jgi:cation:H+ antiporter